jgi:hypothetical protein
MQPSEGCRFGLEGWERIAPNQNAQCFRESGNGEHRDCYEPREPYLIEDGFPIDYFSVVRKRYRIRRFERRQRRKRSE